MCKAIQANEGRIPGEVLCPPSQQSIRTNVQALETFKFLNV
jgi:hypothetical protein